MQKLVADLGLGADLDIQFSGKPFSYHTRGNDVVTRLHEFIESFRRRGRDSVPHILIWDGQRLSEAEQEQIGVCLREIQDLPRLSRNGDTLREWIQAGHKLLPFFYGKEFQAHSLLAPLVEQADTTKKGNTARHAQRKLIKRKLEKAWGRVARLGPNKV